jgi:hypothetical protein
MEHNQTLYYLNMKVTQNGFSLFASLLLLSVSTGLTLQYMNIAQVASKETEASSQHLNSDQISGQIADILKVEDVCKFNFEGKLVNSINQNINFIKAPKNADGEYFRLFKVTQVYQQLKIVFYELIQNAEGVFLVVKMESGSIQNPKIIVEHIKLNAQLNNQAITNCSSGTLKTYGQNIEGDDQTNGENDIYNSFSSETNCPEHTAGVKYDIQFKIGNNNAYPDINACNQHKNSNLFYAKTQRVCFCNIQEAKNGKINKCKCKTNNQYYDSVAFTSNGGFAQCLPESSINNIQAIVAQEVEITKKCKNGVWHQ